MGLPLHDAIRSGNEKLAASLIENGASLSAKSLQGYTPLHMAAFVGAVESTKMLLQRGADKDPRADYSQCTPLYYAARSNHTAVVRVLLEAGADPTRRGGFGDETPMIAAITSNALGVVKTMIELGVDVDEPNYGSWTPLHRASEEKDSSVDMVDLLIGNGANVDARDADGSTPLHFCTSIAKVRSLVNHGADVNAQNKDGSTPLHSAVTPKSYQTEYAISNMVEIVDFLLEAGADETVVDNFGGTALMRSMRSSHGDEADQVTRARELLANAPADRADRRWRRRAPLVMCVARHRRGEAQLLDDAAGGAGDDWTRVAVWVLGAGLEGAMEGIFRTIVMLL